MLMARRLTEVEQKAAAGVFDDANVRDRALDWDGMWQSVYPYGQRRAGPCLQTAKKDPENV